MRHSRRRLGTALALALAACAKQQPLPVANFVGVTQDALTIATGQQVVLDASNSVDPSGANLSFQWSFLSLPAGSKAKIESPHNPITRFTADVPTSVLEKYVLSLTVRNQYFVSVPRTLTITALECGVNAPVVGAITAAPSSINVATPVLLTAGVDDKDNDAACQPVVGNVKQTARYRWTLTALPPGSKARIRDPAAVLAAFDPDVAGTYTATLIVTDSTGRSSAPVHIDVQVAACGGAAPGVNSITSSPSSPNLAQPTQLTADVSDADNSPVCGLKQGFSYAWRAVGLPRGSNARLNDSTAVNPSFTPDLPGDYSFVLVATDPTGLRSPPFPSTVTVKSCGGAPPIPIVQFVPSSAAIGLPVSLNVTPQDDDSACGLFETFSYAWSLVAMPGGSHASILAPTAAVASLLPDVGGEYAINVTITDSRGTSASAVAHLTVAPCGNNPPSVDGMTGLPLTPLVGQTVHVTAQVSDADSSCAGFNPAQNFRWTLSMRPAGSAAALNNPIARAADFVPDVIGHYQLSLVVTDATNLSSAPALFDVQTSTCGKSSPQIMSMGASNPSPDPGTPFVLFAQTFDPDNGASCNLGQTLSLLWVVTSRPSGSSATLSDPAAATPSFTADLPGSYQFSAVATDSTGLSSPPSFLTLGVTTCGTAIPTVTALPSSITVQPFQRVNLSATPFDPDTSCGLTQTFTYAWTVVSAPPGSSAILSDPGAVAPSFVPDLGGTYLLSVVATDSRGHVSPKAFATVGASACASLPPTTGALQANPAAPALGAVVALAAPAAQAAACFSAGANTALQYAWALSKPLSSAAVLDNPTAAAPRFTPDVAGAYQAALVVRDSHGLSSTKTFLNLNLAPCGTSNLAWNAAPELTPVLTEPGGASLTASFAGGAWNGAFAGTRVALSAGFLDPPGCGIAAVQPFTYQWALVSRPQGSAAHLDSSTSAQPGFVPDLPGDYQVAARVGDSMGAILPTRFVTLHVPGCGTTLPVVAITPPGSATLNTFQPLHLTVAGGAATDADNLLANCPARFAPGPNFTYAWSVSPSGATLASATGPATDFTSGAPGTYTVKLVATAANGIQSLPAALVLTVGPCGSHPPSIASVTSTAGGAATSRPLVGQNVTVTAFATAPDSACGQLIASYNWTLASAPAGSLTATAPGAGASFTFKPDVAGTYQFTVVATDSFGINSEPYTIAVQTALCAPAVASITSSNGAPAVNQPFALTSAAPTDTCLQAPSFAYAWGVVSAPRGSTARLSSSTGVSTGFTADVAGAYQFQVVATDQGSFSSAPATLQLNAGTCGSSPPQLDPIASSPPTFNARDTLVLSSTLHDLNLACGALTQPYRWQWTLLSRPKGSTAALASSGTTPVFVPDLPGSYQLSAQATDALGNVSAAVFGTLTTSPCGSAPPVASSFTASQTLPSLNTNAGPVANFQIVRSTVAASVKNGNVPFYPQVPVALSATVTDADAACSLLETFTYSWSLASAPPGSAAMILNPTSPTPSLVPDLSGEYDVQLTVTDSTGLSSTTVFASSAASAPLLPVGLCGIQSPQPRIAVVQPTAVAAPVSLVSVPVGSPVLLDALPSRDGDVDPLLLTAANLPPGAASTESGCGLSETFSYQWTVTAAPAALQPFTLTHANLPNPSFTASVAGNYGLTLAVSDGARSGTAPIAIHARGVGSATVVATAANGTLIVGPSNGATITTTVFDTDGNPLSSVPVSLAITSGTTGNTLAPTSGTTDGRGVFTALLTSTKAGGAATRNGETKVVQATSGSAALGTASVNFGPGSVDHLDWFVQPCDTPAGSIIKCPGFPEVDGYDQYGNAATAYVNPVTLAVQQQPAGATVAGTLLQNAGTAFNDLSVDLTGQYQLLATVPENLPGPTTPTTGPGPTFGVLSAVFNGTLPPAQPPNITSSTATTARQIALVWDGSLNSSNKSDKTIVQYHVFRAPGAVTAASPLFTDIAVASIASGTCGGATSYSPCAFTDTSAALADGTQYTYYLEADNVGVAVGACTGATCSAPSNVTQQFTRPGAATAVTTTSPAQGTLRVTWSPPAVGTASNYDVRRSSSLNGTYSTVTGGGALSALTFDNGGLSVNTDFFYKIRARITGAAPPATNPPTTETAVGVQGTTLPAVPTLSCSNCTGSVSNSHNSIALSWSPPSGTATFGYEIDRTTTSFPQNVFASGDPGFSGATFTNSAAAGNLPVYPGVSSYLYRLQITNAGGTVTSSNLTISTPAAPWVSSSTGLTGGWINALVGDGFNSAAYAGSGKPADATTAGGAFKFTASSARWAPSSNGIPNGRGITSLAPRLDVLSGAVLALYAGTDGSGVLYTLDGGMTWNPLGTGLSTANVTAVFVDSHNTVWAGTSTGGISKLLDKTTAWVATTTTATGAVQAFAEDSHFSTLYAQAFGGDAGPSFGGLLSINGVSGTTWVQTNTGLTGGAPDCSATRSNASALAVDSVPATSVIYWGSKSCGLLSSNAGSGSWAVYGGFGPPLTVPGTSEITRLVVDDSIGLNIWVATAGSGVAYLKSPSSFVSMLGGPTGWEPTALAYDGTFLLAGASDGSGVYRSTNNPTKLTGDTFSSFKTGLSNVAVKSIADDPSDASHNRLFAVGDQFGVAASTTQGTSWSVQSLPSACTTPVAFAYNSNKAPGVAFLVCQGIQGVFVGTANGTSWTLQPCAGLPATPTFSSGMTVQFASTDTLWLATTTGTATTLFSTVASGASAASIAQTCTPFSPALPSAITTASAIGVDANGALYLGSPGNPSYTFKSGTGAGWTLPLAASSGPKGVIKFFFDTGNSNVYAAGQDDGTGVGGVWRGPISGVTATTSVIWVSRSGTGLLTSMTATGYNGFVNGGGVVPIQFTGTSMTPGQQYANVFNINGGVDWLPAADGLIGGNPTAFALPNLTGVALGSTHTLAATSGAGVFRTTSGGQ